jgi:hypothetical protein
MSGEHLGAWIVRALTSRQRQKMESTMERADEKNPLHHTRKMGQRLREIIDHLRQDIDEVDEPQFKAMFETSAEVLGGLVKTFRDYEEKNEGAWRRSP